MKVELNYIRNDAEEAIEYYARVSNLKAEQHPQDTGRLIRYLIEHKHWSPFEMVHATMYIECTRDIARQILRHRSFSFQEFSQRYAKAPNFEYKSCRIQDKKNRQNSIPNAPGETVAWWHLQQEELIERISEIYEDALDMGIAKECARAILPEGMTVSRLYMTGSIRSWIHYCEIRTGEETQSEHRDVAKECFRELSFHLPNVFKRRAV